MDDEQEIAVLDMDLGTKGKKKKKKKVGCLCARCQALVDCCVAPVPQPRWQGCKARLRAKAASTTLPCMSMRSKFLDSGCPCQVALEEKLERWPLAALLALAPLIRAAETADSCWPPSAGGQGESHAGGKRHL